MFIFSLHTSLIFAHFNLVIMTTDLALLRIDPPFEVNDDIKPIQINDIKRNLKGKYVLISGWGSTTTKSPSTNQLQSVSLKVTKQAIMPPPYGEVIQMLSSKGKGACYGDSGGTFNFLY